MPIIMIDGLVQLDHHLFLLLNGAHSGFGDAFFALFTAREIWIPFYLTLLILLIKKYQRQAILVVLTLIVAIVLADQLSGLLKAVVQRPRPTHDPMTSPVVHNPLIGSGGAYGFVSSHAANAFALALFIGKLIRRKSIWFLMLTWAFLTAYSRIYTGVHFPLDVLAGGILGGFLGWFSCRALLYIDTRFFRKEISKNSDWKVSQYSIIWWALLFTVITLVLVAFLMLKYKLVA